MLLISYNFLIGERQPRVATWRNTVVDNNMIAQRKIIVSVMGKNLQKN